MASKRQYAANRANARRSTGPRSEDGRRASSLNALKHGLRSQLTVIPGENQADFDALFDAFAEEAAPETARDLAAVRKIAACEWRLRRIAALEAEMFVQALQDPITAEKPTIYNIESIMERRAAHEDSPPQSPLAILAARFLAGDIRHFNALTRYEASLDRQYHQAWRDLDTRPEPDFRGIYDPAEEDETGPEPPYTQPTPEALGWKSALDRYAEAARPEPAPDSAETPINTASPAHSSESTQTKPIPKSDTAPMPQNVIWAIPRPARTVKKEDNGDAKPESAA